MRFVSSEQTNANAVDRSPVAIYLPPCVFRHCDLGRTRGNIDTITDMAERFAGDAIVHWSPTLCSASNRNLANIRLVGENISPFQVNWLTTYPP